MTYVIFHMISEKTFQLTFSDQEKTYSELINQFASVFDGDKFSITLDQELVGIQHHICIPVSQIEFIEIIPMSVD